MQSLNKQDRSSVSEQHFLIYLRFSGVLSGVPILWSLQFMIPKLLEQERFFERVVTKSQKFRICNPDFHLLRLLVQVALVNR